MPRRQVENEQFCICHLPVDLREAGWELVVQPIQEQRQVEKEARYGLLATDSGAKPGGKKGSWTRVYVVAPGQGCSIFIKLHTIPVFWN